ncbi:MAG: hypothetical protein LUD22_01975 [Coprobacillus sp.]|nr:hypothetical protein [Coprobacillus sp.]
MFDFVATEKVTSCQSLVFKLLETVHADLRKNEKITFDQKLIGSAKHHLVMSEHNGKDPFDFDINLIVNSSQNDLTPNSARTIFKRAIDNCFTENGFCKSKNKTRVIRIVHLDKNGNMDFSVDFAIYIHKSNAKSEKYLMPIKNNGKFDWDDVTQGYKNQLIYEEYCKDNNLWDNVRKIFKDKRNSNPENKETRALYQEALKEVCDKAKKSAQKNK